MFSRKLTQCLIAGIIISNCVAINGYTKYTKKETKANNHNKIALDKSGYNVYDTQLSSVLNKHNELELKNEIANYIDNGRVRKTKLVSVEEEGYSVINIYVPDTISKVVLASKRIDDTKSSKDIEKVEETISIDTNVIEFADGLIDNSTSMFGNGLYYMNNKSIQGGIIDINEPDFDYKGKSITLTKENRELLEKLVQGEAGNQGLCGAALVAQAIHDTMIKDNIYDVISIKEMYKYSAPLNKEPNNNVKRAVEYIFDNGGCAVRHRLIYFYAPKLVKSKWHETMNFVVEYKEHRFFDTNQ